MLIFILIILFLYFFILFFSRWAFSPEVHIDGPSDIDPVPFGNRCHLYVRIKHPLFTTQKIGLVAGIQYQGIVA